MAVYAGVLAEKAARQKALQSTAEIAVGEEGEDPSDESGDEMPHQDLLPELKKKSAAKKANAISSSQVKKLDKEEQEGVESGEEEVLLLHS